MQTSNTMKSEDDLNQEIIAITMLIQKKHPELSKYLTEMPLTITDIKSPEIDVENLQKYYNSLKALLSKYELELNQKKILNK